MCWKEGITRKGAGIMKKKEKCVCRGKVLDYIMWLIN